MDAIRRPDRARSHDDAGAEPAPPARGANGCSTLPATHYNHRSMNIACITFDLDDTLWESGSVLANAEAKFYGWLERACPEIARTHSCDDLVAHRQAYYASIPEIRHDLTRARLLWLESLLRECGYGPELAKAGFRVFWEHRNAVVLFDDVSRVLGELGERFAIGAITNGNADVHHIGIGHHFDFVVTPAEAGAAKPDSAIFEFALNAAGAAPESVVHVGDDPMRDVAGAAAAGLRTVWMNPEGKPWPGPNRPDAEIHRLDSLVSLVDTWSQPPHCFDSRLRTRI